jgi:hypothetical protein
LMQDSWHKHFQELLNLVSTHLAHRELGNLYSDRKQLLA